MIDLTTTYMGLALKNPLVCSPSPLCAELANLRAMEDAGAGAVVLHSLFEEQLTIESRELDRHLTQGAESHGEALSYFPDLQTYKLGPDEYLQHIRHAKGALDIPVIASLNGVSIGGWIDWAKKIEEAGADGLELNIYFIPTDTDVTSAQVEEMYVNLVREVSAGIRIPVAVKIGPFFSSIPHMAHRLDRNGADALVLFNRFYQPDFDLEELTVVPNLQLSHPGELRLRLRWVAILFGHIHADMAITGGVHTAEDALKSFMAGAGVAMMTSALLRGGIGHITTVLDGIESWMVEHEYESINQMRGSLSQKNVAQPAAFERANYMHVLSSYADPTI
jgi:dihydroorotate dehydrogenase (fumarate)